MDEMTEKQEEATRIIESIGNMNLKMEHENLNKEETAQLNIPAIISSALANVERYYQLKIS